MTENRINRKTDFMAFAGLLIAALLWGVSYPATKAVEDCPTFYILSIRFTAAAIAMALIFCRHFKNFNRDVLKFGFLLSFCITAMYIFATVGIKYTTSTRASFFTCLTFIIVPFINFIFYRTRVSRITVVSVILCLIGIFMLSYAPDMGSFELNLGDILCILASVAGSLHIVFLERVTRKESVDPILFTTLLMGFVALWSIIIALFTGSFSTASPNGFQLGTIIFLGLFCSAAAYLLQSVCQQYVPANRTGVIFAMEPASGCIISVIVLSETMSMTGWLGAAIVMASLIYMEVAGAKAAGRTN